MIKNRQHIAWSESQKTRSCATTDCYFFGMRIIPHLLYCTIHHIYPKIKGAWPVGGGVTVRQTEEARLAHNLLAVLGTISTWMEATVLQDLYTVVSPCSSAAHTKRHVQSAAAECSSSKGSSAELFCFFYKWFWDY